MKVALTGATGYTGGRLLAVLLGRGDAVRALARPSSKRPALSAEPAWIEGDLADVGALNRLVEGVDAGKVELAAEAVDGTEPRVLSRVAADPLRPVGKHAVEVVVAAGRDVERDPGRGLKDSRCHLNAQPIDFIHELFIQSSREIRRRCGIE